MESMQITVLETYDSNFCCVCTQNAGNCYLNIFKNVIIYRQVYISLAQIINETLSYNVQENSGQLQDICINCKNKIVDFYIFKRRNEEARAIFTESTALGPPVSNMLLEVVDQIDSSLSVPGKCSLEGQNICQADEDEDTIEFENNDEPFIEEVQEEFLDSSEVDAVETFEEPQDQVQDDKQLPRATEEPEESNESFEDQFALIENTVESSTKKKPARERHPEAWLRNKRKLAKNKGQSYVSSNGKMVEAKQMKANCGPTCRLQCSLKISEKDRSENFDSFYQLADIARQRKFLYDHMKTYEPKRTKTPMNPSKARAVQRLYFLDLTKPCGGKELLQVCKLMFLNTFSISSQMIDTLHRKASNEGEFSDTRGKFERTHSRQLEFCVQHIKEHRKIDKKLPVRKLYEKYIEDCQQAEVEAMNESNYQAEHSKVHAIKRRKLSLGEAEIKGDLS